MSTNWLDDTRIFDPERTMRYHDTLVTLQKSYLAFAGILLNFQIIKIGLNMFNIGDFNIEGKPLYKAINQIASLFEATFLFAYLVVFFLFIFYALFLFPILLRILEFVLTMVS